LNKIKHFKFKKNIFGKPTQLLSVLVFALLMSPDSMAQEEFSCGTIDEMLINKRAKSPDDDQVTCHGDLEYIVNHDNTTDTSPIKEIPVVFHLLHDGPTNYFNDFENYMVNLLSEINAGFAGINGAVDTRIRFVPAQISPGGACNQNGVNYVDDPLFTDYTFSGEDDPDLHAYAIEYYNKTKEEFWNGCINIFIADQNGLYSAGGYSIYGQGNVSIRQFNDSYIGPKTSIHELGHALGLRHPSQGGCNSSSVTGANCATTGDYICDTPPHDKCTTNSITGVVSASYPSTNINDCSYLGTDGTDTGCDFIALCDPDYNYTSSEVNNLTRNYMGRGFGCNDRFTIDQRQRMNGLLSHQKCNFTNNDEVPLFGFGFFEGSNMTNYGFFDFSYLTKPQNYLNLGIIGTDPSNPVNEIITIEAGTIINLNCDLYFGTNGGIHVEYGAKLNTNNANLLTTSGSWQGITYSNSDQIFNDFTGLSSMVNPKNCNGELVTVYLADGQTYIQIQSETKGTLYNYNGSNLQQFCSDSPSFDCVSRHNLTEVVTSWRCGDTNCNLDAGINGLPPTTGFKSSINLSGTPSGGTFSGSGIIFNAFNPYNNGMGCEVSVQETILVFTNSFNFVNYNLGISSPRIGNNTGTIHSGVNVSEAGNYQLELINMEGHILYSEPIEFAFEGTHEFKFEVENIKPGIYILSLSNSKMRAIHKLVVH